MADWLESFRIDWVWHYFCMVSPVVRSIGGGSLQNESMPSQTKVENPTKIKKARLKTA